MMIDDTLVFYIDYIHSKYTLSNQDMNIISIAIKLLPLWFIVALFTIFPQTHPRYPVIFKIQIFTLITNYVDRPF